jgi:serine/threonine protein kinase
VSDAALHARASELFLALRGLSRAERAARLATAAAEDARLAAEVASLLEHDADPPGADAPSARAPLPERIGSYRVVARIGSGGSGQVFLAEQEQPVRRRVAIKVVPLAAVSAELAHRFEVERAALEATDHPHIARVLDAGRTAEGLPYLVMNFVEGEPIHDYCASRALALPERLRLFLSVADAVQHAHQRGVIHRDLKPANLLVSEIDGRASPQVLDFGIAKPVAGVFAVKSPPTLGLALGTPAYMAPEQAGRGPIDTRADVYGLGAVLYELVAGRTPIEFGDLGGDALEALTRLREEVPLPVSRARDTSLGQDAASEARRRAAPMGSATAAQLDDLDVVLAKSLEKEPERRYASAGALMDDLRRLLDRLPIEARAPTWGYRAARFTQRNRALVAAAAAAVVALVAGVLGLWHGLDEARRQQTRAEDQYEAQAEIARFLTNDLFGTAAPDLGGPDLTARELLDRASARIGRRLTERPLVAAAVHHALGDAYAQLAAFDEAERHLSQAVELRVGSSGSDAPETLHSQIAAASLVARRERYAEAEAALVPLVVRARRILGPDDPVLYSALNDLGVVMLALDRVDEALALLEEALAGRRRLLPADDPKLIDTLNNAAQAEDARGRSEASLALLLEALALARSSPDAPRMTLLGLENNVGATLQDLGRDAEAEPHLAEAAAIAADLLGPDHPVTLTIESNVAHLQADLGEPELALVAFQRVIDGQTATFGERALDTLTTRHGYWSAVRKAGRGAEAAGGFEHLLADVTEALGADHSLAAQTEISLAYALSDAQRPAEARLHARAALERLTEAYGPDHPRTARARELVTSLGE